MLKKARFVFIGTLWKMSPFGVFFWSAFSRVWKFSLNAGKCRKKLWIRTFRNASIRLNLGSEIIFTKILLLKRYCVKIVYSCEISKQQNSLVAAEGVLQTRSYIKVLLELLLIALKINKIYEDFIVTYINHYITFKAWLVLMDKNSDFVLLRHIQIRVHQIFYLQLKNW